MSQQQEKHITPDVQTAQPGPSPPMTRNDSAATSSTAVGTSTDRSEKPVDPRNPQTYEEWYPGDASKNGRPAWWNRIFCCGYGVGCLLCPCGSWNCKQERL